MHAANVFNCILKILALARSIKIPGNIGICCTSLPHHVPNLFRAFLSNVNSSKSEKLETHEIWKLHERVRLVYRNNPELSLHVPVR